MEAEILPFSEKTLESQRKYEEELEEFESRKKARNIVIPTDDKLVQLKLRELGEPIIYFGERPGERRERLREVLAKKGLDDGMPVHLNQPYEYRQDQETFYTEGTPALKAARVFFAKYSLPRAKDRIENQVLKRKRDEEGYQAIEEQIKKTNVVIPTVEEENTKIEEVGKLIETYTNTASQVADERPLSYCSFSPNNKQLVTAGWSGMCKIWNVSDCSQVHSLRGHRDRATAIVYHPGSGISQSPSAVNLASCGVDQNVCLWSLESETPLHILRGHGHRINRVAFHPSGRFVGSTSCDLTWKLWDVEAGKELLEQEGHSRSVFAIGFQGDGALVGTAGNDYIGRIWDLRSGKSIWTLRGHSKQILSLDFSPNGYQIATGSEDNTIRVWDMRKKRIAHTIPAHSSLVSVVKYHPDTDILFSSSFDNTVKFWNTQDWTLVRSLKGTEAKIMYCDVATDFKNTALACYDRTFKIYSVDAF